MVINSYHLTIFVFSSHSMRAVIIDDHPEIRSTIRSIIEGSELLLKDPNITLI